MDWIANSHYHRDHRNGNQVFPGAQIFATELTRQAMVKTKAALESARETTRDGIAKELDEFLQGPETPDRRLWGEYLRAIVDVVPTLEITLPDVTFASTLTLHGRNRTVELLTYGGGHSASDAILYLPEERIAFLGDLLFIDYQPYLGEGDIAELLRTLDRIKALDARVLVPGHGRVGTPADIDRMRSYVLRVEKTAREVGNDRGRLQRALETPIEEPFASWKFGLFYRFNLEALAEKAAASH